MNSTGGRELLSSKENLHVQRLGLNLCSVLCISFTCFLLSPLLHSLDQASHLYCIVMKHTGDTACRRSSSCQYFCASSSCPLEFSICCRTSSSKFSCTVFSDISLNQSFLVRRHRSNSDLHNVDNVQCKHATV